MELGRSEMIDHVYDTCMANRMATLNRRVAQCREKMRLSSSGGPNQNGTAVPLDEIAVEQAHDRGLGDPLGELEVIFRHSSLNTTTSHATRRGSCPVGACVFCRRWIWGDFASLAS